MTGSKVPMLLWTGFLCAILGMSAATEAQALFVRDDRPPPNGSNGLSLNGLSANGLSANGLSANGLIANGLSANGLASHRARLNAVILPDGEKVDLR